MGLEEVAPEVAAPLLLEEVVVDVAAEVPAAAEATVALVPGMV